MEELELLSLVNAQITDAALEQLPPLKGLRRLLIYNTKVSARKPPRRCGNAGQDS